jgi:hypothetical protein
MTAQLGTLEALQARAWETWRETGALQLLVTTEELDAAGCAWLDSPHCRLYLAEEWPNRRRPLLLPDTAEERERRRSWYAERFPGYQPPRQLELL